MFPVKCGRSKVYEPDLCVFNPSDIPPLQKECLSKNKTKQAKDASDNA